MSHSAQNPQPNYANLKFMQVAGSAHKSFKNLFTGGAEHRKMMLPEANAALLSLVCKCIEVSKFVAKHISCQWSQGILLNAENLKENMATEYSSFLTQWKKQVEMERGDKLTLFPRTTIAQKNGFKDALKEEKTLMEMILNYTKIQMNSPTVREEHCKTIAVQAATLSAVLSGLVDEKLLPSIQRCLTVAIVNCMRKTTVSIATKEQKSSILNRLQNKKIASNVVMELGNFSLYVISYEMIESVIDYVGFIFVDAPVHQPNRSRKARIAYVETLPCHRRSLLAKRMIQWVGHTAKENGYQSLYTTSMLPNGIFWVKCGFSLEEGKPRMAVLNLDPMNIENLINRASA